MYISLLFWLSIALPGYVIVRHFWEDELKAGLMGTVALSYFAGLGLLSSVSILCYLVHAPLWVFSAACFISVVAAVIELTRQGWWRASGKLLLGGLCFELAIVAADLILGGMVGAKTGGDAPVHLSRIRVLLDHGFNNFDPFVGAPHFFSIYHTNLLHALQASCSQITGVHHISVWFASLPWAKLLVYSGAYYLAWSVFERRWVAWVAVVFTVAWWGPVKYVIYPNKLTPLWLLAMMMGFAVQACRSTNGWRVPLKLLIGSLLLGQLHSLYGAFAGIAMAPLLAGVGIRRFLTSDAQRWQTVACILAPTAALPFLLVSKLTVRPDVTGAAPKAVAATAEEPDTERDEWVSIRPRRGWGRLDWRTACLAVAISGAMLSHRRRDALALLAISGTVLFIHVVPPLCTLAMAAFQKKWILGRMGIVLDLAYVAIVPASFAFLIEPRIKYRWLLPLLSVVFFAGGLLYPKRTDTTTWKSYHEIINAPREARKGYLKMTEVVLSFCQDRLPDGETVLIEDQQGMVLTMVHDCHIVAPKRGGNGVMDLAQRRVDLNLMLDPETPWETRRELLRKYDITYFFPAVAPVDWVRGHLKEDRSRPGFRLFVLDTER